MRQQQQTLCFVYMLKETLFPVVGKTTVLARVIKVLSE